MYNAVDGDVDLVKVDQQVRLIESYHHHVMIWSASRLVACKPRPTSKLGHCQVTARFLRSITPRDKYRSPPPYRELFTLTFVAAANRRHSYDRRTLPRLLFHEPTLVSAIMHFQLLDHGCGTAFRPTYGNPTLPFSSSAGR